MCKFDAAEAKENKNNKEDCTFIKQDQEQVFVNWSIWHKCYENSNQDLYTFSSYTPNVTSTESPLWVYWANSSAGSIHSRVCIEEHCLQLKFEAWMSCLK
jgi:hypothetical protein